MVKESYRKCVGFFTEIVIGGRLAQFQLICAKGPFKELQETVLQLQNDIPDKRWMELWGVLERVRLNPQYQGWDGIVAFVSAGQLGNKRALRERAEAALKKVFPPQRKTMISLIIIDEVFFKKIKRVTLRGGMTLGGSPDRN